MRRRVVCWHRESGAFWFRIFGRGLAFRNIRKYPLLFSERNGYADGWLVKRLR